MFAATSLERLAVTGVVHTAYLVEVAFLFPWAVTVLGLGWTAWAAMMIFIVELALGLAYAWKKGALEWE